MNMKSLLLVPVLALLAACGGGGGDSSPSTPETPTLKSITVTPANQTIPLGGTLQMAASGLYSDGKTSAITTGISWTIKGKNATIGSSGLVSATVLGTDTVTATVGSVSGSTGITISQPWAEVFSGGNHAVVLKKEGSLWTAGSNGWGQLGDGTTTDRNKLVVVNGNVLTWKQVAVGEFHTVAVRSDGTLWTWGFNQNGQLGTGTTIDRSVPVQVGAAKDWISVAAGKAHSLAVNKTGQLWAWGRNFNGQLGDGTKIDRLAPTRIGTAVGWKSVSAGATHTIGLRTDGTIWTWGANESGQLGNGNTTEATAPAQIGTATWVATAAGSAHTLAVRADGALFAWGANAAGQLGDGTALDELEPKQVGTDTNWANSIAAGDAFSLAVKANGSLWAWGSNSAGQLGLGSNLDKNEPTQVGVGMTWRAVSAGLRHAYGIQTDSTVWVWGRNLEGQLAKGDTANALSPAQLP